MLSSRNILTTALRREEVLAFTPEDRLLPLRAAVPLLGCVIGVMGAFTHGACLCVVAFESETRAGHGARERLHGALRVPTMFIAELESRLGSTT